MLAQEQDQSPGKASLCGAGNLPQRGRDHPSQSQLWTPKQTGCPGRSLSLSKASSRRVWECWGGVHSGLGVLETPAELFRDIRKAIFENLVGNQKRWWGGGSHKSKKSQIKNCIFTLRNVIRKWECKKRFTESDQQLVWLGNLPVTTVIGDAPQGGHFLPSGCPSIRSHRTGMLEGATLLAPLPI